MRTDLWYFYESDLNKGCLVDFHNFLPEHLRKMFKESMGGYNSSDRDVTNVLQGYNGPHNNGSSGDSQKLSAIGGLQEVKYWWGASKHLNWVPIVGTLVYGISRACDDTKWHSLFKSIEQWDLVFANIIKEIQIFKLKLYLKYFNLKSNQFMICKLKKVWS